MACDISSEEGEKKIKFSDHSVLEWFFIIVDGLAVLDGLLALICKLANKFAKKNEP
jgi:hypothetical protein